MFKKLLLVGLLIPAAATFTAQADNREIVFEDKDSKFASAVKAAVWGLPGVVTSAAVGISAFMLSYGLKGESWELPQPRRELNGEMRTSYSSNECLLNGAVGILFYGAISYYLLKNAKWNVENLLESDEDAETANA